MGTFYHIGTGNAVGKNDISVDFNNEMIPKLLELGVSEKDMPIAVELFRKVYHVGYENGIFDNSFFNDD